MSPVGNDEEQVIKGDFTRFTFDPKNRFSGVLTQQGRVNLDADWNELAAFVDRRIQARLFDILVSGLAPRAPHWTDLDESDPGVTLVELFAFLADNLLCRIEKRQRQRRRLASLVVGAAGTGFLLCAWRRSRAS